ncbi:MAG TPA: hypothetical protein VFP54_01530 [Acidimicrobiales bacterium]|nr:hypothetical protein [Acidimicrobiales bacterium]
MRRANRADVGLLRWPFALLGLQLAGMLAFSTLQYSRYSLSNDFGGYAQAWYLIGHGDMNPYVSVFRSDFLHNNLDLMMYPLALLGRLIPSPVLLSWAQDCAIVATEFATLLWVRDYLRLRSDDIGSAAPYLYVGSAALLAVNPWSWETAAFSLHFGAFAALFAVLATRDLWRGRYASLALWVPLGMASEALGGLYVMAGAAGALLTREATPRNRAVAGTVLLTGAAGLVLATSLHLLGRSGQTLQGTYGYLIGTHTGTITPLTLLAGLARHPGAALRVTEPHLVYVLGYVLAAGLFGIFSGWGIAALTLIILPNAMSSQASFIAFPGAFQSWPAQPFIIFGTVTALSSLCARYRSESGRLTMLRRLSPAFVAVAVLAAMELIALPHKWLLNGLPARELAAVADRIPHGSAVYADQDFIGRLSERRTAYAYVRPDDILSLTDHTTVLIVTSSTVTASHLRILGPNSVPLRVTPVFIGSYWRTYLATS